jgi:hypothetical protein
MGKKKTEIVVNNENLKYDWEILAFDEIKNSGFMTNYKLNLVPGKMEDSMLVYLNDFNDTFFGYDTPKDGPADDIIMTESHNNDEVVLQISPMAWSCIRTTKKDEQVTRGDYLNPDSEVTWFPDDGPAHTAVIPAGTQHTPVAWQPAHNNTIFVTYHPSRLYTGPIPEYEDTKPASCITNEQIPFASGAAYWYDYLKWRIMFVELAQFEERALSQPITTSVDTWVVGTEGEFRFVFGHDKPLKEQEKVKVHGMSCGIRIGPGVPVCVERLANARAVFVQFYEDDTAERDDPVFLKTLFGG